MDTNKLIMLKEVEQHKNELCLDYYDVVELLDFKEDDEDYYYEVLSLNKGIYWLSGVTTPIWLKNQISEKDYTELKRVWDLNKDFTLKAIKEKMKGL